MIPVRTCPRRCSQMAASGFAADLHRRTATAQDTRRIARRFLVQSCLSTAAKWGISISRWSCA
jgi:hypothetical protein